MLYAALFVIVLIVVSGVIAYTGDILGRRMGKKRLTLFGLRPRHTAIVVTTITGMLIAALTLATLLGVNHQVRYAMVHGQAILKRNIELNAQNRRLSRDQRRLTEQFGQAKDELRVARDSAKKLDADIAKARNELTKTLKLLADERARLRSTREELAVAEQTRKAVVSAASAEYNILRGKPVIFESHEEIFRSVVEPKRSIPAMRAAVIGILNQAGRIAEEAGARKGKNRRAVVIITKMIRVPSSKGEYRLRPFDEKDSLDSIAEALSKSLVPVVVQVVAAGNAVQGEQVTVDLGLFNNKLVFYRGETVAETTLDGSEERAELLSHLAAFLMHDVRRAATNAGVIPVSNPRERERLFGEVGYDELLDALDKIKQVGGPVQVRAVAANDVYTAGPLPLDFVVAKS